MPLTPFAPSVAIMLTTMMAAVSPVNAQPLGVPAQYQQLSWTDWADLALASEVVLTGSTQKISRLGKRDAPDVPPGQARALVQISLQNVLRAPDVMPKGAAFLWQGGLTSKQKIPFNTKQVMLVFARKMDGGARPEVQALQLVAATGMQPWTPQSEALIRDILTQAQIPGARGWMVTGVSDGFHAEGDVPGNSESQFFLTTEGGSPITLVVRRKAGMTPVVLAASGEMVGRATAVSPQTLLWRGLTCGLPATLPPSLDEQAELKADYETAKMSLGNCGRTVATFR